VLDETETPVATQRSTARKLADADVRQLLSSADTVVIARGRKSRAAPASEIELEALKGPTGNYRAPMVLAHRTLLVGFNAEALSALLAD